jgi:threonine synthase
MKYISTRGKIGNIGFTQAVLTGLGDDGGLILPETVPDVSDRLKEWQSLDYTELASRIVSMFSDLDDDVQRRIVVDSYRQFRSPEVTPVTQAGGLFFLELYHGPTLAFKDIALQFLGRVFEHILGERGDHMNILGATSGDTGSAAIHGVKGRKRMAIFILHPKGRVSPVQERQMTSVTEDNVHNLALNGNFDDCQRIAKEIFCDLDFKNRYRLGSINSINWARLLPQIVYYFYAYFRINEETGAEKVSFSVPTGNFGDIFAGYLAYKMGLPVHRLILATNQNDILHRFFSTGVYGLGEVQPTLSPSMDIQVASNFERYLYYRTGCSPERVRELMAAFSEEKQIRIDGGQGGSVDPVIVSGKGNDESTLETIGRFYRDHNYLLDPHTAVGVDVALQFEEQEAPIVCLATAHPAKFPDAIKKAVGRNIAGHPLIDELKDKPTSVKDLDASTSAVKDIIEREALRG